MPDLGTSVECNNCGKGAFWAHLTDGRKALPPGWTYLLNTTAGDVYFCSIEHKEVWKTTRQWEMGPSQVQGIALESGFVAPVPELMDGIEIEEPGASEPVAATRTRAPRAPRAPRVRRPRSAPHPKRPRA